MSWIKQTFSARGAVDCSADALLVPADQLRFRFDNAPPLPAGSQPSRLRIDGVDSWLIDRTQTPPVFDASQAITVPP